MWGGGGVYIQKLYREKVGQNCFTELALVTVGTVKLEICRPAGHRRREELKLQN